MSIRPAIRDDLPRLLSLLEELREGATPGVPWESPDTKRAREVFSRILRQPGRIVLVAEEGGEPVGAADLIVVNNLTHGASPIAYVENVVVTKAQRRRGIGRALMERAISLANEAGCYKVQLLSFEGRKDAHEFYRSLGFENSAEGFRKYLAAR